MPQRPEEFSLIRYNIKQSSNVTLVHLTTYFLLTSNAAKPAQTTDTIMANWSKMKREILVGSQSDSNFAIQTAKLKMDPHELLVVSANFFFKTLHKREQFANVK